jgi:uncharacterized protein YpbB
MSFVPKNKNNLELSNSLYAQLVKHFNKISYQKACHFGQLHSNGT